MNSGILLRMLLAAALLCASLVAAAQVPVPALAARVTDLTSTLSAGQTQALEGKLEALEAGKGSQIAVLLVPTVRPETIEQYAVRVFEQWKLGRKGIDDGVLLVIAKSDRKLRIEVGYGLEGAIPDAIARRIIDEDITPRFKQGDFYGGIDAGVGRIAGLIAGEKMPAPDRRAASRTKSHPDWIFIVLVGLVLVPNILRTVLGRALGSALVGIIVGVVTYIVSSVFAIGVFVGIFAWLVTMFAENSGGGWSSGGGGGGFSGGGGGGFSGGGGSSGGGGASGGW
jgi:uncharacterized protein